MADPSIVRMLIDQHFSLAWCRENVVVPIEVTRKGQLSQAGPGAPHLVVAIGNITFLGTIGGFIKHRASRVGLECQFIEMPPEQIQVLIDQASALRGEMENGDNLSDAHIDDLVNAFIEAEGGNDPGITFEFGDDDDELFGFEEEVLDISNELLGSPLQRAAAQILIRAIKDDVSDIHVQPHGADYRVLLRQDGVMRPFFRIPNITGIKLTAVLKTMASMNVAERRESQDGRILRKSEGNAMEFRVSTLPGKYGEKMVIRVLKGDPSALNLDILVCNTELLDRLRSLIELPSGVIYFVGPTGSGKSTTMYSAISEINNGEKNIVAAEDPIEWLVPGITQVQVLREKDQSFAKLLHVFMRQDSDVLVCGEIRDDETSAAVLDTAIAGCLVLAGLHSNSVVEALLRIAAMKHPSHKLVALKGGLIAQHLMRRNCTECSSTRPLGEDEIDLTRLALGSPVREATCLTAFEKEVRLREGSLCQRCQGAGYKGRVAVYELLAFSEEVKTRLVALSENFSIDNYHAVLEIQSLLVLNMLDYGRALVRDGITTVSELEKLRRSICSPVWDGY